MQHDRSDRPDVNFLMPASFLPNMIVAPLGISTALVAIALAISAIRVMFAANTPLDVRKPSTEIVTSGVFQRSRNPIYLGMLLHCSGVAFLANSLWLLLLVLPLAVTLQKGVIEPEEAYLERKFGDKYLRYKAKVRRWI
jgi:protein-S-isoprenylcysteine O-methyltransferase Ste14